MGSVVGVLKRFLLSIISVIKPTNPRFLTNLAVDFQCKMSVIGIDIGNENCYIAVARAGGIETIANEYSQRHTPTYVAFGERTRDLGVSAKNKQITNLKNTIFGFKRLIGRKFRDLVIQNELGYLPFDLCELPNGDIGIKVIYLQEETVFTVLQIMAMMLTKIKDIAENALQIKVQDCVISVPVFFTDVERRAILDAAEIAGLNPLKLMNETAAVSLAYGFYKQDLVEDKPKNVILVDLGNSMLQITACALTNNKLKVIASVWDRSLGGRDFDNVLVKHFVEEFRTRYKLNVLSNRRALMRLMQECEKLKKQMSANSIELPLNIECFMEDKDVTGRMKREVFESLCMDLLANIETSMRKILVEANLKLDDIDSVQVVGGSSRMPSVKNLVKKVFGKEASTTLNQDEAVARGCALQCAMLSPTFKVRDFAIADVQPYPINLAWKEAKIEEGEMEVFPRYHQVPFSRMLTFYRMEPFTLEAAYSGPDTSYGNAQIGMFTVQGVVPTPQGENAKVKVKARVNIHGIFSICSATMLDKQVHSNEQITNSPVKVTNEDQDAKTNANDAMDNEKTPPNGDLNNMEVNDKSETKEENGKKEEITKKSKNVVKSIDLPIQARVPQLSRHELMELTEKEGKMIMQDKMEKEKADAKNAVEEYVYEMRGKLNEEYERFISSQELQKFMQFLDDTENWLYDEGEDQQKSVYCKKLSDLKQIGDPVVCRFNEWQQRPSAVNDFGRSLQLVHKALESYVNKEEQYSHIEEEEMKKVKKLWEEKEKWLGQYLGLFSKLQQHENPPITTLQLRQEREVFENTLRPILNKPKPKVEPPPSETSTPASGDNNGPAPTDSEMSDANSSQNPVADSPKDQKLSNDQMETN